MKSRVLSARLLGAVYRIRHAGVGHDAAGRLQLLRLVVILATTTLAAWIASMASGRVLSSYAASASSS